MANVTDVKSKSSGVVFATQGEKLKTLFFHPTAFFEGVASETSYWTPLIFYAVIFLIVQVLGAIISLVLDLSMPSQHTLGPFMVIVGFVASLATIGFSTLFACAGPFINSAFSHLGVMAFKGKNGYFNTYKPSTYAYVIGTIYGLFILVASSLLQTFQPIAKPDMANFTGLMDIFKMIPTSYYIVFGIIGLISMIHVISVEVIGISRYQQITKGKAFLAVIIPRVIIMLIVALVLILLFSFITALIARGAA